MMPNPRIADLLATPTLDTTCSIDGWVRTRRDSKGGFSFVEINDGSCMANLQIIAPADLPNYETAVAKLHPGSAIRATGVLTGSEGQEQAVEMKATEIHVYGFCDILSYPLQKQRVSLERLREAAHLRVRTNTFGAVARVRNTLSFATHRFFQERQFLYLNTPIITCNDCEGAGQMFRVSTLDPDKPPRDEQGNVDYSQDFFSEAASLTVSGQLEAEAYACGASRVYTFGPTFRAENSNTPRHLAEFWMVEPEVAFCDLTGDIDLAEEYLKYLFKAVLNECEEDLAFFNKRIDDTVIETLSHIVDTPFHRLPYTEAIELLEKADVDFEFPVSWGIDLQTEHERYLTETAFSQPVAVTDYPRTLKPFYMRCNDDGKTVAAMDVLLPKIGEIIGGSQREERLDVLLERMHELDMDEDEYAWYVDLRRFGSVPHAGFGLGFERLVQFATGMANIRDVIPFPRTPHNAKF